MNYHVIAQMKDGSQVEGIIEDMDDEGVTMMVPEDVEENESRIYGGYGGYGRRRYRRYRRRRFPFYAFAFPFIFPFPFYY
ncbi:small nuclear ribonucleoprotein [Bacillus sp. ISL-47]|nr:small nuclear ribonucleoprotein [Bacillus sp. ISL-47]